MFRGFVKTVVGHAEIYPYADSLSSINIHYAERNQELGWHPTKDIKNYISGVIS